MPPAITVEGFTPFKPNHFNLPEKTFLFHFNFDFASYSSRKNPEAVIEAYRLAFRSYPPDISTALVIKTRCYDPKGKNYQQLIDYIDGEADIIVINEELSYSEALGLMNCCDCYISLHRSEGFGYTLAEAMLLGKPVIATNYSGSKDFVTTSTGFPVDYKLIPLEKDEYPFAEGQKWANPDLDQAAWLMRRIINEPFQTKTIAMAGKEKILSNHHPKVVGERYLNRLRKVGLI
jgi:glycosyltransferase involved in cell wall biosynthesis